MSEPQHPDDVDVELERKRLVESWSFEACCFTAFDQVRAAWVAFGALGEFSVELSEDGEPVDIGESLAHGAVVPAFLEDALVGTEGESEAVDRFAEAIIELSESPSSIAAVQVLAALNAERGRDDAKAEKLLIEAIELDPTCGTAAVELADYCVLRNQLGAAIELLRRAEVGNDSRLARLEAIEEQVKITHRQAARNEPCTCGADMKFKNCCGRDPKIPATMRLELITQKLGSYLTRVHRWHRVVELADAAVPVDVEDGPAIVARMSAHPLVHDLVCFEGGVAAEFLVDRGSLLPDGEAALIEGLIAARRGLWEVMSLSDDGAVELREVVSGATATIQNRSRQGSLVIGDKILGRTLDVGPETFMAGIPVTIPLVLHDATEALVRTEPGAVEFATWFATATS